MSTNEAWASGDLYDVHVYNVSITNTNRGLALMPRWGTSNIYNVLLENINIQTQYFSENWWGSAEPIYITGMNYSDTQFWGGKMNNITLSNISAMSENGVVIASFGPPITDLVFTNINIVISQFTNYSRPCHDWRPAPGNALFYAPTNGFYLFGGDNVILNNSFFVYLPPIELYWGTCLNVSGTTDFQQNNVKCKTNL
eukprot:Phypoly_transcript_20318.p1 GENE.Phypoly_transcript_20318~~Phypoly_transcript_20318.p1  ORF type:complete len:219 (+),score=19.29 Phypoly_transcript_20318:65-658(+)